MTNVHEFDIAQLPSIVQFKSPAAHFKYCRNVHQPIWCSYSLHQLKSVLEKDGGMIFDENGTLLYSKIVKK